MRGGGDGGNGGVGGGDPSVLTADRVCVIWALQVSLNMAVS